MLTSIDASLRMPGEYQDSRARGPRTGAHTGSRRPAIDWSTCALEIQCTEEPLQRAECTADGCVCIVEGVVVKDCPEGSCTPEEQLPSQNCCEGV